MIRRPPTEITLGPEDLTAYMAAAPSSAGPASPASHTIDLQQQQQQQQQRQQQPADQTPPSTGPVPHAPGRSAPQGASSADSWPQQL
ncbi:hypothetical protein H696_02572 [Fonticula alba]|uniref:Uncharacterized protein n=1 Tax=Fonticula alba TaxID=691883 RepID=A0A058Z9N3_FONAL|nr:hypothetical protein H696_02572 [Fonticula alba]KCV70242.1 hypothetical protein H696_02572 [Fonticula alba]|eukprot:XP_009494758.1 hypothetical protein H696_02572 [Fonticula alba]